jgi:hypothetical protein
MCRWLLVQFLVHEGNETLLWDWLACHCPPFDDEAAVRSAALNWRSSIGHDLALVKLLSDGDHNADGAIRVVQKFDRLRKSSAIQRVQPSSLRHPTRPYASPACDIIRRLQMNDRALWQHFGTDLRTVVGLDHMIVAVGDVLNRQKPRPNLTWLYEFLKKIRQRKTEMFDTIKQLEADERPASLSKPRP